MIRKVCLLALLLLTYSSCFLLNESVIYSALKFVKETNFGDTNYRKVGKIASDVFNEESVASTKRIWIYYSFKKKFWKKNHDIYCSRGGSHFFVRYDIGMSEYWIYKEGWVLKKQIGTQVLFEKTQVGSGKYHQVLKNLVRDVHWNRYYISNRTSEKNYHFIIVTIF